MKSTLFGLLFAAAVQGQISAPTTSWNSTFKLSPEQVKLGFLSPELASTIETILNFDRTQLANGGPTYDEFYTLGEGSHNIPPTAPGQVIKVEKLTDSSAYNIPAQTALSRIIYSSTDLNGTLVPASAYILWPYTAKIFGELSTHQKKQKAPVVLWTHGTSGFYADGAPSAHRSLFYGDYIPFTLAQAGYAVVAPDYAGLGVGKSWDGSIVEHQYFGKEASATDALNALRAVRKVFSDRLTKRYVVVGHSQGGLVAWGISEVLSAYRRKYQDIYDDHLGTWVFAAALNPFSSAPNIFLPWTGKYLHKVYSGFKLENWLTPVGVARTKLLGQIQGGQFVSTTLFSNYTEVINPNWNDTWYARTFEVGIVNPGNRPWKGPMIIAHGTADIGASYEADRANFESTCKKYPGDLEFVSVPEAGHFAVIQATRPKWLQWIEDRFEGKHVEKRGCVESDYESFLPVEQYKKMGSAFLQWSGAPQWFFQLPAA